MSKNARLRRARYIRQKIIATPKWAHGPLSAWPTIREAKRLRKMGRDVNVDHIVPLNNPLVCGLHCSHNVEIVHRLVNVKKSNLWWPDAPYTQERMEYLMITWHQLGLL